MAIWSSDKHKDLPPEVVAQLKRLEELEAKNAELEGDKEALRKQLIDRGYQVGVNQEIEVEPGVFRYQIDLPPSGGISIGINGVQFYHGQAYNFSIETLRTVKEMVYRSWDHERNIKGSDENAYRPQLSPKLNGRGRFA